MSPLAPIEQLPLTLDGDTVQYVAEDGTHWELFKVERDLSTVSTRRMADILKAMIAAYNGTLGHVHNTDKCDPDGHVVFVSVCCGARLYRCTATTPAQPNPAKGLVMLPSKPLIHQGEDTCRSCGTVLAQF